jgi:hypothetical protein
MKTYSLKILNVVTGEKRFQLRKLDDVSYLSLLMKMENKKIEKGYQVLSIYECEDLEMNSLK